MTNFVVVFCEQRLGRLNDKMKKVILWKMSEAKGQIAIKIIKKMQQQVKT